MKINSEALKFHRDRCELSQEALASVSKVSKKTISRIESGTLDGNRKEAIERLARALGITHEELCRPPKEDADQAADTSESAYRKLTTHLSPEANLAFALIEERYGVKSEDLIEMAPLSFLLLAEASLNWRRARNIDVKSALGGIRHPYLEITFGIEDTEQVFEFDASSIEEADIFGENVRNELRSFGRNFKCDNPFIEYLIGVAKNHAPSLVEIVQFDTSQQLPSYMIRTAKIEELTGGDDRARYALAHGYALRRDIPAELQGDEAKEQRIAWLAQRVPDEKWEKHQKAKSAPSDYLKEIGI